MLTPEDQIKFSFYSTLERLNAETFKYILVENMKTDEDPAILLLRSQDFLACCEDELRGLLATFSNEPELLEVKRHLRSEIISLLAAGERLLDFVMNSESETARLLWSNHITRIHDCLRDIKEVDKLTVTKS